MHSGLVAQGLTCDTTFNVPFGWFCCICALALCMTDTCVPPGWGNFRNKDLLFLVTHEGAGSNVGRCCLLGHHSAACSSLSCAQ